MRRLLLGVLLACLADGAAAAACTTATAGGNWNTAANWSCVPLPNHVPVAADTVIIDRNFTVNAATANVVSITMTAGTLTQSSAMSAQALTITGGTLNSTNSITINGATSITAGSLNINATTGAHNFNGNVSISGTGTWNNGANEPVAIQGDLSRASTATFTSGTGTYTFSGAGQWSGTGSLAFGGAVSITGGTRTNNNTVTVAGVLTVSAALTNAGSLTVNNNATATAAVQNDGTLNITGTLAVTNPGALTNDGTMTVGGNVTVTGTLRNDAGTMTMNGATGVTVTGGTLRIEGGTVNVGDASDERIVLTSNAATTFLMNGGALNVAGRITNSAAAGAGSFTLNGGDITVGTSGNTQNNVLGAPFFIASGMTYVLGAPGGRIVIQQANTQANAREYDVNATVGNSTITAGTVQITAAAAGTFQIDSVPPLPNFQIDAANSPAVTLMAALTVNGDWTNDSSGTFTPGGFTVTFAGSSAQTIGGAVLTPFAGITLNNANGVSLSSIDASATGVVTFTAGDFSTGSNTLRLGTAASVSGAATNRHVVGNLAKSYSAAGSFTYTLGDGTNYTPATLNFTAMPTIGSLTVSTPSPAADHPDTTAGTSSVNSSLGVNRYWTLKSSTLAGTFNATLNYISGSPVDLDSGVTASNFVVARGTSCTGSAGSRTCITWSRPSLGGVPTTTQATANGMSMTVGAAEMDFAVGEPVASKFLRERQFIYTRELY